MTTNSKAPATGQPVKPASEWMGKAHDCAPKKPNLWAPGALHGTHEHDEATEWQIFKLDPEGDPGSGDIVSVFDSNEREPSGDGPFSWWQAKAICDAHNRDVKLALDEARQDRKENE